MKYRIIALLLTVATLGGFGWHNSRRLSEVREQRKIARGEAERLGIGSRQTGGVVHKPRLREEKPDSRSGKMVSPDDIAFMKNSEDRRKNRDRSPSDERERFARIIDRLKALSASQISKYVTEVRGLEELTENSRRMLIEMAVGTLTENSPEEGLDLYLELMEKHPQEHGYPQMEFKFAGWAVKDPEAALAWVRRNMAEHGESISDRSRCVVIDAIALKDRKLAFRLIGELELETPADATQGIVGSAKTAEERIAALADLREYLPTIEDKSARYRAGDYAIAVIGRSLVKDGFQTATDWADSAGLTASELASFGSDIGTSIKDGDQGKWVEWFGEKLPLGKFQKPVRQAIMYWTDDDYHAAGTWLASAPAGPVKNYAITIFADEVSSYEPEAAIQWAVTLPEGVERQNTLHKIYHNWPKKDPAGEAAAAAFEKEYNIQHEH